MWLQASPTLKMPTSWSVEPPTLKKNICVPIKWGICVPLFVGKPKQKYTEVLNKHPPQRKPNVHSSIVSITTYGKFMENPSNSSWQNHQKPSKSSWWFNQPIWNILVKIGIFPNFRGENEKNVWVATNQWLFNRNPYLNLFNGLCNNRHIWVATISSNSSEEFQQFNSPPLELTDVHRFFRVQESETKSSSTTLAQTPPGFGIGLGKSWGVDDSSNLATPTIRRAENNPSKCLAALALA